MNLEAYQPTGLSGIGVYLFQVATLEPVFRAIRRGLFPAFLCREITNSQDRAEPGSAWSHSQVPAGQAVGPVTVSGLPAQMQTQRQVHGSGASFTHWCTCLCTYVCVHVCTRTHNRTGIREFGNFSFYSTLYAGATI